jgi:AraC family transcriptional regulator, regulatory protein of adaptative response / DNA-3-methyladenine glycosylase II
VVTAHGGAVGSVRRLVEPNETCTELAYRPPLAWGALIGFLGARAVPGVEEVVGDVYRRVLTLPSGPAVVELAHRPGCNRGSGETHGASVVSCRLRTGGPRDLLLAVAACRRLLDLDANPALVDAALATDHVLGPLVRATPGRRAPGHVDADELAVRAVLGQQVTLAAARGLATRLATLCGQPLAQPDGGLSVAFPTAAAVATADLDRLGMPASRRTTLRTLGTALAASEIRLSPADRADTDRADTDRADTGALDAAEQALLAVRGIGPWTASYIRMRGLGDPDVFLAGDVGVRKALTRLGIDVRGPAGRDTTGHPGDQWRPWRSYAVHHLWASLPKQQAGRRPATGSRP